MNDFKARAREIITNYFVLHEGTDSKPECLLKDFIKALKDARNEALEDAAILMSRTEVSGVCIGAALGGAIRALKEKE